MITVSMYVEESANIELILIATVTIIIVMYTFNKKKTKKNNIILDLEQ